MCVTEGVISEGVISEGVLKDAFEYRCVKVSIRFVCFGCVSVGSLEVRNTH